MVKLKYVGLVTVEMTVHENPESSFDFDEIKEKFSREFGDTIKEAIEFECDGIKTDVTVDKQYADMYGVEE